jgi:DNA-binding response OmpR family regulator
MAKNFSAMASALTGSDPALNQICMIGEADPFLTSLVKRIAEKSGFIIKRAQTGETLLDQVQKESPALIVLEPDLPGKVRGWEVVRSLKRDVQTRQITILLFSWLRKEEALALVGETLPYLAKPDLSYEDFMAALKSTNITSSLTRDE